MSALSENWATLWESLAAAQPDHTAVVVGGSSVTWRHLDDAAARLAGALAQRGIGHGSRVAQLMYNCPEYIEAVYASFKLRATPVNVNYRYLADEIAYILDNADAEVLVFHGSLGDRVAQVMSRTDSSVRLWLQVDDGSPLVEGAVWYHEAVDAAEPAAAIERSGEDLLFLFTGGTTGLPKGVMWRHVDLWGALATTGYTLAGLPVPATAREVGETAAMLNAEGRSPVNLCAPPLMHGTALFLAMSAFVMGGSVVLLGERRFDAHELLRLSEQHRATQWSIVGDAFARPITAALNEANRAYDLSSLQRVVSTGATLSAEHKRAIQQHAPQAVIVDMIGASEGGPFAMSMTMPGTSPADTAVFTAQPNAVTLDEDGRVIPRGTGVAGMLAVSGPMPQGYHKDPDKTATTFRTIDGVRYTVPGDFAIIDDDGTVHLLGRGSVCINTGGEKVYPEEVEVAARSHPGVLDCNVVGVPDDRFGHMVVLVASPSGSSEQSGADLDGEVLAHIRRCIAAYKVPKRIVWVDVIYRSPSGKADYRWAQTVATGMAPAD
jgi:3-oxocholest-4-en-26-oate---CoA ligase